MVGLGSTELLGSVFAGTAFQMNYFSTFFSIPVIMPMSGYAQSVIPIILSVWVAAKIYKVCYSKFNDNVKVFMAPFVVLVIMVPATYIIIGPIATMLSNLVGLVFTLLYGVPVVGGVISGVLIGAFWQVFVIFVIHWGLIPITLMNFGTLGYDFVLAPYFACSFAQSMVVLAIILKTKDSHLKKIAIPAFISGLFGVTEPAIYGITLPKKKPFIISCVAGAIGGGIIGAAGVRIYSMAGMGFFALSGFIDPSVGGSGLYSLIWTLIGTLTAMVVGFVLTYFTYKDDEKIVKIEEDDNIVIKKNEKRINVKSGIDKIEICSPLNGKVIPLDSVHNASFANGTLGLGAAILPKKGELYAPCDGYVTTLFPTGHAIGITSDQHTKILIHIGIDTVRLEGKYFKPLVKQGDRVKQNQKILEFDIDKILKAGYSLETPVIILNSNEYLDVLETTSDYINSTEVLLTILK
jgi:PTS system beta-glucosides-specific IIC component